MLIGAGANRKLTAKSLSAFVDKQGIPFISTQMGKGVVDESHPLCIGNAALSAGDFLHRVTEPALRPIRRFLPNLGGIDLSPIVLILLLFFAKSLLFEYMPH